VTEFYTIRFFNENIGIATSLANRFVYRTLDGGETLTSYPLNFDDGWSNDIEFVPRDPAKIFAVFDASLYFSSDTGKTWKAISTPYIYNFRDIEIIDAQHRWIVGEGGIIHTATGGITSISSHDDKNIRQFELGQNFPNPFNSTTTIAIHLSQAENSISLKIYNLIGEEVANILNDQFLSAGKYYFEFKANCLASGIYLYRLQLNSKQSLTNKLILIK
jgi:hypothetical protein